MKRALKKNLDMSFLELVILEKLIYLYNVKIDAVELKKHLNIENTPISVQINHLSDLGLFKKSRDVYDERRIFLHDIDFSKIKSIIKQYHLIVDTILSRKS
ncbi:transcriptional regulator, SarA/Rot family [Staphylococcus shinii]|uniref:transcriptional regulator, SarA/Rot family n=1 Tax=Staphylococcus shinii TaxID=2912228 RepID=UPI0021756D62|nr:MarR family transcriptional regulator [Staphylococcus shinii]